MTEGIIQKTFNEFLILHANYISILKSDVEKMEQELISEIKREFESVDYKIIEKLIGDTK